MEVKIAGNIEYLNNAAYFASLVIDGFVPNQYIWIMSPVHTNFVDGVKSKEYSETVKIICSPKNRQMGQDLVDKHNLIYNSPLAQVMRENEEKK